MSTITLVHEDCKVALRRLVDEGVRVHSIVTDPPYGLVSITKRFGNGQAAARVEGTDGSFSRLSGGFMNRKWDGTGIELDVEMWRLCHDILLPGGYLLAFSSPRTGHRMACAIEDAGFIMHPFIGWAYGQGFPKGKKVKLDGWEGWEYGAQARKPALEPIYVAQKPFTERNGVENIRRHGVGAVNIDGCRVPTEGRPLRLDDYKETNNSTYSGRLDGSLKGGSKAAGETTLGRHPANLIHDGSPQVAAQFPDSKGQRGDASTTAPSPRTKNVYGPMKREGEASQDRRYADRGATNFAAKPGARRNDTGSAARFFESYPYLCQTCQDQGWIGGGTLGIDAWQEACPDCGGMSAGPYPFTDRTIFYHSKATAADRAGSTHPTVKPIGLMQALVRHVTPPGGTTLDPFAGTGTTGEAARREGFDALLIERDENYVATIERRFGLRTPAYDYIRLLEL